MGDSSVQLHVGLPETTEHEERTYRVTFHRERPGVTIDTASDEYEMCRMRQVGELTNLLIPTNSAPWEPGRRREKRKKRSKARQKSC